MGVFTININANPTIITGAQISATSVQPGSVKFTISGADLSDVITVGIKVTNMSSASFNYYYLELGGTLFNFSPTNSGVEIIDDITHTVEPKEYNLIFYDTPDADGVLVEIRLISSTGTLSSLNQHRSIGYNNF